MDKIFDWSLITHCGGMNAVIGRMQVSRNITLSRNGSKSTLNRLNPNTLRDIYETNTKEHPKKNGVRTGLCHRMFSLQIQALAKNIDLKNFSFLILLPEWKGIPA
jgi:hypothetical protein